MVKFAEDQPDRVFNAAIRVFLQSLIVRFHKADRGCDDQLAATRLLAAGFDRPLTKQIEFVLVETPLEPQQHAIVALARSIDRLVVN